MQTDNHRKHTPKRRKKPLNPDLIVKILLAITGLMSGIAALITALKH